MINFNNTKGSIWRKWDLHFHTPSSHDYHNKSVKPKEIIDTLFKNQVSAVAITDHHIIDAKMIKELQEISTGRITIFPSIEFCSELGGSELMHYIGIFPETCDIDDIFKKIEVKCKITTKDIKERNGYENLFCDFEQTSKLIHDLGGLVSVHAGKKGNSIESIKNKIKDYLEQEKCIDILEVGKVSDSEDYINIVFPNIKRKIPIILCSDNHNIKDYSVKENLWVKADTTFEGLIQILYEPEERVFIGDKPEILDKIISSPTKFIKSLKISKTSSSNPTDKWFDNIEISLNPELVAIIGNKGKGKSAVIDTIGAVGCSHNYDFFSFLNERKFNKQPKSLGKNFTAGIEWLDGNSASKQMSYKPKNSDLELVKYIPQRYLESLCNEINEQEDSFQEELKNVIFSHVPEKDRAGCKSLKELEDLISNEIKSDILKLINRLKKINEKLIALEIKNNEDFKILIKSKKDKKEAELKALKPIDIVLEPDKSKKTEGMIKLSEELNGKKGNLKEIEKKFKEYTESYTKYNSDNIELKNIKRAFEGLKKQYDEAINSHISKLNELGINIDDVINFKYEPKIISDKLKYLQTELDKINKELKVDKEGSCAYKRDKIKKEITKLTDKLDEPTKKYQTYLEKIKIWNDKKKSIEGSKTKEGTLEYYKNEINYIEKNIKKDIDSFRNERIDVVNDILVKKNDIINEYSILYKPVDEFIKKHKKENDDYQVNLAVSLDFKNFENKYFTFINQSVVGSFRKYEQGEEKLKGIKNKIDMEKSNSVIEFLNEIIYNLEFDTSNPANILPNEITKQIKPNNLQEFYDFLFGLEYLQTNYKLLLGNKLLSELSPGEKGAVLLIFYLLIDKNDDPLLIDQPEDNLDNESVYRILVEYIKVAKKRRQIIIVTHNPNLAVVCDAEQIISVNIDKKNGNKFSFISGAIENPKMNSEIIRILEGTMPAFDLRDKKYSVSKRLQKL
jgi:ABC-type lipoprotein export system ATPase subunit